MKLYIKLILIIILCTISVNAFTQIHFDNYFTDNALRIDYYRTGNSKSEQINIKEIKKSQYWAGTRTHLIYPFNYGAYQIRVYNKHDNELIFSYNYDSLFEEWQYTKEAKDSIKSFPESILIPFPKNSVIVEFHSREETNNNFVKISELEIDPNIINITPDQKPNIEKRKIYGNSDHKNALDIVFLAEGYTHIQINDFFNDAKKTADYLLSIEPFNEHKNKINIWAVGSISEESGTDIPHKNIWKSTIFDSNFNTFNIKRYLTPSDYHTIIDYASLVPCDQICILVNIDKYGGGGIFNFWNITSAKDMYVNQVFAHELGHSLAYLGDEYSTSDSANENMFDKNKEPLQPNLTTLVNFDEKWKDLIASDTPIPTPKLGSNSKIIGVYEGGGYKNKGVYRPYINCRMKSLNHRFCPVCQLSIIKIIDYYCNH